MLSCRLLLCAQSPRLAELIQAQTGTTHSTQVPGSECRWTLNLPDIYPDILALMLQVRPLELPILIKSAALSYGRRQQFVALAGTAVCRANGTLLVGCHMHAPVAHVAPTLYGVVRVLLPAVHVLQPHQCTRGVCITAVQGS
jgi:hypothetical protein